MHTAIISLSGAEYKANEKGIIQLPIQNTRANLSLADLAVTGRIKSDKVTGCGSNIITADRIILKDKFIPTELKGNTYIFDLGLIGCCSSGQRGNASCTSNHGSYPNCSDAYGIWGDNCVTRRDVCMDFNGRGTDCVKRTEETNPYFLGSDCQIAMIRGHCWNEVM